MSFTSRRRHVFMTAATAALAAALPLSLLTFSAPANATSARTAVTAVTATQSVTAAKSASTATTSVAKPSSAKAYANGLVKQRYKSSAKQWTCLKALWHRESGWRVKAGNPSGAYGIPQAYPGKKMGKGWRHSATTQIKWGLRYIDGRYGSPCGADRHQRSRGWY